MEEKDFYEILQVSPNAEQEVIEAAYKRLALKYHPDYNKSPDAVQRMQEINEAYATLSNTNRRYFYDTDYRKRKQAPPPSPSPQPAPSPEPPTPAETTPPKQKQPASVIEKTVIDLGIVSIIFGLPLLLILLVVSAITSKSEPPNPPPLTITRSSTSTLVAIATNTNVPTLSPTATPRPTATIPLPTAKPSPTAIVNPQSQMQPPSVNNTGQGQLTIINDTQTLFRFVFWGPVNKDVEVFFLQKITISLPTGEYGWTGFSNGCQLSATPNLIIKPTNTIQAVTDKNRCGWLVYWDVSSPVQPPQVSNNTINSPCPYGCDSPPAGCNIKGNIGFNTGEKIYHVPGGIFYDSTTIDPTYGEKWFCTEQEAINNGWRRSSQ